MKKTHILILAVISVVILLGGAFTVSSKGIVPLHPNLSVIKSLEQKSTPNRTTVDIYAPKYKIKDEVLNNLTKYENQKAIPDGILYTTTGLKGENIKIVLSSLAIHNAGLQPAWTVLLNANKIHEGNQTASLVDEHILDLLVYNQVYMYIPKVTVTVDGKDYDAILPANRFYIDGDFIGLYQDNKSYLEFDFINDNTTLFKTTDGQYVYAPKMNILAYVNVTASIYNDSFVNMTSGVLWTNITVGTDINGRLMSGYKIDPTKEIVYNDGKLSYVESNHLLNTTSL
jgi:hypothetical protein